MWLSRPKVLVEREEQVRNAKYTRPFLSYAGAGTQTNFLCDIKLVQISKS